MKQVIDELISSTIPTHAHKLQVKQLIYDSCMWLQVKEVIDELIRVEQSVTSWEQRAADLDKERARLASEAESERLIRVQQNQQAHPTTHTSTLYSSSCSRG